MPAKPTIGSNIVCSVPNIGLRLRTLEDVMLEIKDIMLEVKDISSRVMNLVEKVFATTGNQDKVGSTSRPSSDNIVEDSNPDALPRGVGLPPKANLQSSANSNSQLSSVTIQGRGEKSPAPLPTLNKTSKADSHNPRLRYTDLPVSPDLVEAHGEEAFFTSPSSYDGLISTVEYFNG